MTCRLRFSVITLFPDWFSPLCESGVLSRAKKDGIWDVSLYQLRDYATDKHSTVDGSPYGGGAGMVLMYEPLRDALRQAVHDHGGAKVILLSPRGHRQTQQHFQKIVLSATNDPTNDPLHLVLVCGRYEGVDERFIERFVDESWCMGDYVLTGGEIPAMAAMDALVRLIPGALGNDHSAQEESFTQALLEYPHYTKPSCVDDLPVPSVLLSGHHAQIHAWRHEQAKITTKKFRPDLLTPKSP